MRSSPLVFKKLSGPLKYQSIFLHTHTHIYTQTPTLLMLYIRGYEPCMTYIYTQTPTLLMLYIRGYEPCMTHIYTQTLTLLFTSTFCLILIYDFCSDKAMKWTENIRCQTHTHKKKRERSTVFVQVHHIHSSQCYGSN